MSFLGRFVFLLATWALSLGAAERVGWEPAGGTLSYGEIVDLALVFDQCEPLDTPVLPKVDGFVVGTSRQSSQQTNINGRVSVTVAHVYSVRPNRRGTVEIPGFTVATDRGPLAVSPVTFEVRDSVARPGEPTLAEIATATLQPARGSFWAGEVFPVDYTLSVTRRYQTEPSDGAPEWTPSNLLLEPWIKPKSADVANDRYVLAYRTRALAREPSVGPLPRATLPIRAQVGERSLGWMMRPVIRNWLIESNAPELTVKPLPTPAPAAFLGAVGDFKLESKIVPETVAVGEPVTWTLTLSGSGNWPANPALPAREFSQAFRALSPQAKREMSEGSLFEGTLSEDLVLVPTRPGRITLGPVRYAFFDPRKGAYQSVETPAVTIVVNPSAAPATAAQPGPPLASPAAGDASPTPALLPAAAPEIPGKRQLREPLAGGARGNAPTLAPFWTRLLAAAATLGLLALGLALWHSRARDPLARKRRRYEEAAAALAALRRPASDAEAAEAVRRWQLGMAELFDLGSAAPTPAEVARRLEGVSPVRRQAQAAPNGSALLSDSEGAHARLWSESERVLYGRRAALPEDWIDRAEELLRRARPQPWRPWSALHPRHLFPFLLLFLVVSLPDPLRAAPPSEEILAAYRAGDFARAESLARQTLAETPLDWQARHNLSLALAQQERWAESAAQISAAFLLAPGDDAVRWQTRLALSRAGYAPPRLNELLTESAWPRGLTALSPAGWQRARLAGLLSLTLGLAALLLRAYRGQRRRLLAGGALALSLAGLLALAVSAAALRAYGIFCDNRAALVWQAAPLRSVPTEADAPQQAQTLPAGSVGLATRDFFGWTLLTFPNGQTGWVRREALVRLYGPARP